MVKKKNAEYPARNRKHPWAKWLDGNWHELTEKVDFDVPARNMRIQVLTYCRNNGIKVETRILADNKRLALRKTGSFKVVKSTKKKQVRRAEKRVQQTTN